MNKWAFFFVLIAGVVIVAAIATWPITQANANNINARNAALARIAAAEAQEAEAKAQANIDERLALSPWLEAGYKTAVVVIGVAVVVVVTMVLTTGGSFAYTKMAYNQRLAQLPVTRQIAPGAYVFQGENGRYWLLDAYTGRQCLLSNAQDVESVRAGIVQQQTALKELGQASAQIARYSKSSRAADWLFSTALSERLNITSFVYSENTGDKP